MNELSLYILDLAQNSVAAKATRIRISIEIDTDNDKIRVLLEDNGCGMDEARALTRAMELAYNC